MRRWESATPSTVQFCAQRRSRSHCVG